MAEKSKRSKFWSEWLPLLSAMVVAVSSMAVAWIAASTTRENTQKDYVALAITVLQSSSSSQPSKRWAVEVLSESSPVSLPEALKQGLISGKDTIPLEPLPCLNQLRDSNLLNPLPAPSLPKKEDPNGWMKFSVEAAGQLATANNRLESAREVLITCTKAAPISKQ